MDLSFLPVILLIAAALYCLIKLVAAPMRLLRKFIVNTVVGFLMLLAAEIVLGFFDISLGISLAKCFIAGVCGIPGVIVMILLVIFF